MLRGWLLLLLVGCAAPDAAPPSPSQAASTSASTPAIASAPPSASSAVPPAPKAPPVTIAAKGPFDVIDLHVDTPWRVHFKKRALSLPEGDATPDMLRRGGYAAIVFPIYIPDYADDHDPQIATADAIFDTIDKLVAAHDLFTPALAAGALSTVPADRVAVFVSIEGAGAFAADITQIDRFIQRGVRLVGPVHAHDNKLATSATGKGKGGLSDMGAAFCERVYKAGALVDVSHMSDASFDDLVPIAARFNAPIVATHSNARALAKNPRNLTDEQLAIIGKTGGVVGLNLHRPFVSGKKARMADVVAQVRHLVKTAGIDHVAIGSDYDGGDAVSALEDAGHMQSLAEALLADGMSDGDVRKLFAANALRILRWGLK